MQFLEVDGFWFFYCCIFSDFSSYWHPNAWDLCLARDRHASVWWINLHAGSCQGHSGASRECPWQRNRLSRLASRSHKGCSSVNVDSTGTAALNGNLDPKEWISYAKGKSWHVCVLDVFVLMYALGSIINQQCLQAENSPPHAVPCTGSKCLTSFTISSG